MAAEKKEKKNFRCRKEFSEGLGEPVWQGRRWRGAVRCGWPLAPHAAKLIMALFGAFQNNKYFSATIK